MRLFRQSRCGDWDEVFERITQEVRKLVDLVRDCALLLDESHEQPVEPGSVHGLLGHGEHAVHHAEPEVGRPTDLAHVLAQAGIHHTQIGGHLGALARVEEFRPELVILDVTATLERGFAIVKDRALAYGFSAVRGGGITINTDLLAPNSGARVLELGGVNTGNNTFAGKIIDGNGTFNATTAVTRASATQTDFAWSGGTLTYAEFAVELP